MRPGENREMQYTAVALAMLDRDADAETILQARILSH